MYTLFLDESGDDGDYLDSNGDVIFGSSKYLVVGGIIIKDTIINDFDNALSNLLDKYFIKKGIVPPQNFKLHCTDLNKGKKFPYNQLTRTERQNLADEIFDTVSSFDCAVIAASLDLEKHCNKYNDRINAKAYMLFLCYEKLVEIKKQENITIEIIYEEFNHIRKKIKKEITKLLSFPTFPNPQNLRDIENYVKSGKQNQHSGLQFADFIANAIWFARTKPNQKNRKMDIFYQKFFCTFDRRTYFKYIIM